MAVKCGTILSMGKEQEVKREAVELLGSGIGGNGNSQEWLSHGPALRLVFYPEPPCPAGIKDTGTNPAFTRAGALGEQMSPCSFTERPKPLFPNARKGIWAVTMSILWLQGWLVCF